MEMHAPLSVEVLTPNPMIFRECIDCEFVWRDLDLDDPVHRRRILSQLPTDAAQDYLNLTIWVDQLLRRYGDQVHLRVIDADTMEGITKSAQYGINAYPAVVINRRHAYTPDRLDQATEEVAQQLCEAVPC